MTAKKSFGYGSLSLLILAAGVLFMIELPNQFAISPYLFNLLGVSLYSSANNTGFYLPFMMSIVFWLLAVLVSRKHPNDFGASIGNRIGELMLFLSGIALAAFVVSEIF